MRNSVYGQYYKGLRMQADCRIHEEVARLMARYADNARNLLDIACGEGALSQRIKDRHPHLDIDVNDHNVEGLRFKEYRSKFDLDLNGTITFPQKYDLIAAVEIAEHVENPQHLLRTMKAYLNDGGKIILSTPSIDSLYDRLHFLFNGRFLYFTNHHHLESGHMTPIARWQMEIFCQRAGLRIVEIVPVSWQTRRVAKLLRMSILLPFLPLMKDIHQTSINIFVLEKDE